jgi:transposase
MGMKAIPVAVRERILKLYGQGKGTAEIAASFGYCVAAVRRVRQHFKARGTLEPQTHRCGRKTLLTAPRQKRLLRLLDRRPDATLAELGAQFKRPTSTLDLWLARLGWSCKKKRCTPPSSRGPTWRRNQSSGRNGWRACPPNGWCS